MCERLGVAREFTSADGPRAPGENLSLGKAGGMPPGLSHDGFHPLQRLMRRVNDE
ncbi:hypothetical protein ABZ725_13615 [Streptomyces sp. NPDC006872]|uniref:hypothetical protein n=1 Tax=Streptomyces sp. NPDC006872 TaxID=3155720 RepID=UPI0033C709D5